MKKDRENSDDASAMVASNEINNEHSNANDKKRTIKSIDFKNMRALLLSQRS